MSLKLETNFPMTAKTMAGLEQVLADELKVLGAENIEILQRAVGFRGNKALMYKANLWCRTALRILMPIADFEVKNEDELYANIYDIKWEDYIDADDTLAVDSVINGSVFTNSLYISQKTKDAIVDRFSAQFHKRPSVNLDNPDLKINIHINHTQCIVSLDSSVVSLHKRGYRQETGLAPINEVLAAGLILLSGWKRDCNFLDTMCGSGTFLIEAAMISNNIPPGYYRKEFGFQKWKDFDSGLWKDLIKSSLDEQKEFDFRIIGSDISNVVLDTARENITFSKFHKDIELFNKPFEEFDPPAEKGILIINPPYGERMHQEDIISFYKSIGDTLKRKYAGYEAYIISSNMDALKFIGLKPSKKFTVFNGPLECRFCKFELYEGSKKASKNEPVS